jgi:hypothetical protein
VKKRAKGDSGNELENRLRQSKWRARSLSVSADASVRFCTFLFRHRTHVQDRHSSIGVQRDILDKLGESTVETRKRENPVRYTPNLIRIHESLIIHLFHNLFHVVSKTSNLEVKAIVLKNQEKAWLPLKKLFPA